MFIYNINNTHIAAIDHAPSHGRSCLHLDLNALYLSDHFSQNGKFGQNGMSSQKGKSGQ